MPQSAVQNSAFTVHKVGTGPLEGRRFRNGLFALGLRSMLSLGLAPFGKRAANFHRQLSPFTRLEHGLIIILPGIEGCSSVNDSIARGLVAGRLPHAVKIIDWRKYRPWNPLHLAMQRHNRIQAKIVADSICDYQRDYPHQPVHLIGHSAGAGMALFILDALPDTHAVESVILMAAAVSRKFDIQPLLKHTRRGIWNFYSPLDLPTVGLGTIVFGTMDRRHAISAGAMGFRIEYETNSSSDAKPCQEPKLHQIKFRTSMMKSWNFGGHFGSTNAVFVQRHVAPLCVNS
jgi:pimeloyl-ACP methyl ester carboxylesterase